MKSCICWKSKIDCLWILSKREFNSLSEMQSKFLRIFINRSIVLHNLWKLTLDCKIIYGLFPLIERYNQLKFNLSLWRWLKVMACCCFFTMSFWLILQGLNDYFLMLEWNSSQKMQGKSLIDLIQDKIYLLQFRKIVSIDRGIFEWSHQVQDHIFRMSSSLNEKTFLLCKNWFASIWRSDQLYYNFRKMKNCSKMHRIWQAHNATSLTKKKCQLFLFFTRFLLLEVSFLLEFHWLDW